MMKLLFAVVALSMLAPFAGIAEPTHPNEIGLYTEPNGYGETGTYVVNAPVTVYLVLTKPEDNNGPLWGIRAFECQLNFTPAGNMFLLGDALAAPGLNIGDTANFDLGYLEYIVGFSDSVPVINHAVVLITFSFLNLYSGPVEVTMGPASNPIIPGQMALFTPIQTWEVMYPISGAVDAPVFIFNGQAVAVENDSFGSVKAMYR